MKRIVTISPSGKSIKIIDVPGCMYDIFFYERISKYGKRSGYKFLGRL